MNKKQYVYWSIIFIVFSIYAVILAYYCYKNTLCYPYLSDSYRSFFDIFVLKDNSSFGYILSNLFEIDSIINILPLYPFSLIFKGHYFFFFIIGNLFLYTIPLIGILLFTVFTKIINWRENKIFNVFIITSILFMPQLYLNTFLGLSEISNLILIFLLIYKTYNIDFSKKLPVKNMILLGLTLYAIFFLRRFYCVFDISYIIAIILINIPRIINSKELEKSKLFFNLLKNILIVGFAFTFFFLVFNFKYVISSLSVGNSVYEAYNCGVIDNLIKIVHSIGILQISLLIISIILIIIRIIYKKEDNQYIKFLFVIFLFYSILMCLYMINNEYILFIQICSYIFIFYCIWLYMKNWKSKINKNFILYILMLMSLINFKLYVNYDSNIGNDFYKLFAHSINGLVLFKYEHRNYEILENISNKLEYEIKKDKKEDYKILVLGGSYSIDFFTFKSYFSVKDINIYRHIIFNPEMFTYEGFVDYDILDADYVIIITPVRGNFERIDFLPAIVYAEDFLKKENLNKSYKLIFDKVYYEDIYVDDNEKYIRQSHYYFYKKQKRVTPNQVKNLFESILREVPEYKENYNIYLEEYKNYFNIKYLNQNEGKPNESEAK